MPFVSGLASGIDTESIIKQLLDIERRPAVLMQQRQDTLQLKLDAYRDVNTRLTNLDSKLRNLVLSTAFETKTVTSSNESIASGTAVTSAVTGSYDLNVTQLARAHRIAGDQQADSTSALGLSGTVQINGTGVDVTADMSLQGVRDAIIDADVGVTASILNDTLVVESQNTGTANAIALVDSGGALTVSAGSDNTAVVTATADNTAQAGAYAVNVTQLATNHQVQGSAQGSSTSSLGLSGTFDINGVQISVGIGDTLQNIRDNINNAGTGVTASISAANELVLTSDTSGSVGQMTASDVSGTVLQDLGVLKNSGVFNNETVAAQDANFSVDGNAYIRTSNSVSDVISGVALDFGSVGSANVTVTRNGGGGVLQDLGLLDQNDQIKNELQAAQDSTFSVNGISMVRSGNSVDDAISGLTLSLNAVGSTTIMVDRNVDNAVSKIQEFVDQYNSIQDFIGSKVAKDALLQGDSTLVRLSSSLQIRASDSVDVPAGYTYDSLSIIGISIDKTGVMSVDDAKLRDALQNSPEEVRKIFSANSTDDGFDGVAVRMRDYIDSYTKTGTGIISTREKLFEDQMDSLEESINRLNDRLDLRKESLVRQFTEMEKALAQMQSLSTTLAGQIAQMSGFQGISG